MGFQLTRYKPELVLKLKLESEKVIEHGKEIIKKISPDLKVLNGPFKGMVYPSLDISELALVPKIVGSYEGQLHPVIQKIISTPYSDIINVGSAEGYYSVGFAMNMPSTIVHCYDINKKDMEFCKRMAEVNQVSNLTYNLRCDQQTLIHFDFKGRGLVFCDCEGYELSLFNEEVIKSLKHADILVELHDVINPSISGELLERFQDTHHFQIINTRSQHFTGLQGLDGLSEEDRNFSVFEHRGGLNQNIFMEWAFFRAKDSAV